MTFNLPFAFEYRPHLGGKTDYGIGFIGAGGIVQYAHIPAYRRAGFNLVAVYDVDTEKARAVAAEHGIGTAYESLDELLADPAVAVVDIAVPPWEQRAVAERVAAAGKHMLCQKPLSDNMADAVAIVEAAHAAGVRQAINQQMRWDPAVRISHEVIKAGLLGQPTDAQMHISIRTPWHMWPWLAAVPRLDLMFHSIHYLDAMRYLFGDPEWVTSRHSRYPGQDPVQGETKNITILDYASGLQVLVNVNHYNEYAAEQAIFRYLGTEGAIDGTVGRALAYPTGQPDTLTITSRHFSAGMRINPAIADNWMPHSFIGPMAALLHAIETDTDPQENSTADNLNTLRLLYAAYRSAAENRSVAMTEMQ
jgi:predicted dehydrogenase